MNESPEKVQPESIPGQAIYRILVCRPNHRLGNMLLLTPLIIELERLYRGAEIDIVAEGNIATEVFATFSSIKNIYCLPKRGFKHPISFLSMLFHIRRTRYDLIIDPSVGSNFGRTLTRFFNAKYKLGFDDPEKRSILTHRVPNSMAPRHMAIRPISLVRWHAGTEGRLADLPPMDIRLTDAERERGRLLICELLPASFRSNEKVVIGIFANATGAKRYPREWWNEFIAALKKALPGCAIVEIIPMHGQSMLGSEWPGYYTSSIRRMGAVMSGVDLMISADCGVMHLAVASKVPTIGMFCVTDASVYAPYGPGNSPLLTQGQSATEAAQGVIEAYSGLLDPREQTSTASTQGSTIPCTPNDSARNPIQGTLRC